MKSDFAMKRTWGPIPNYPLVVDYVHPKDYFVIISGSCSVESESQIKETAKFVASCGATHLRGGVFRAGTYPGKSFGWVDENLIRAYHYAAKDNGLFNIIEVLDYRDIDLVSQYASAFQVGARQQQNYVLLHELGQTGKPIFLKRNMGSTVDEWLGSAEHLLSSGCKELYLIERGSSTYNTHVRWDLSISMIPAIQAITKIPVIVDASHGTGRRDLVATMTLAGVAAGANGVLIETHKTPAESISDADQAITFNQYQDLIVKIHKVRGVLRD